MTLLFMPDISGFTSFVNSVEINHSKHIIKELLELLIAANEGKMTLAEIEGDALFYYQDEEQSTAEALIEKIQEMHRQFHAHLLLYHYRRVCNCGACTTASNLQLKFIVHVGETEFIEVNGQKKPFGPEVIKLHRLLKNKASSKEYILFSEDYWKANQSAIQGKLGMDFQKLEEHFDFGDFSYTVYPLHFEPHQDLDPHAFPQFDGIEPVSFESTFDVSAHTLFQYIADLSHRIKWLSGLDDFLYDENHLNQVGTSHTCVVNGRNVNIKTIYAKTESDHMVFAEDSGDVPFLKSITTFYTVMPLDEGCSLDVDIFAQPKNTLSKLILPFLKKQLRKNFSTSMDRLHALVKELPAQGA